MIMLAPFATLAFLTVLWLVNLVVADMLNKGIGKIIAALKGHSALAIAPSIRPVAVRISQRSRPQPACHAQPRLRAAA
jgi:hypothetical protein